MSRIVARESLVKLVFEYLFLNKIDELGLNSELSEAKLIDADKDYIISSLNGIVENHENIENIIKCNLKDFSFSQIFKMDLAILYVSIYEIKYLNTPYKVVINEALNIAKKYSTEKSASFINGVLSSIIKYEGN